MNQKLLFICLSVSTFLKICLLNFEDQIKKVTPSIVHTLSKSFSSVCNYSTLTSITYGGNFGNVFMDVGFQLLYVGSVGGSHKREI